MLHIHDNILLKVDEVSLPANCTTAKMLAALVRRWMVYWVFGNLWIGTFNGICEFGYLVLTMYLMFCKNVRWWEQAKKRLRSPLISLPSLSLAALENNYTFTFTCCSGLQSFWKDSYIHFHFQPKIIMNTIAFTFNKHLQDGAFCLMHNNYGKDSQIHFHFQLKIKKNTITFTFNKPSHFHFQDSAFYVMHDNYGKDSQIHFHFHLKIKTNTITFTFRMAHSAWCITTTEKTRASQWAMSQ